MCREENQLDVTVCFIAFMIRTTCFSHLYAHHQELYYYMYATAAYGVQCLAAGCRGSGAGQQGVRPGRGMLYVLHPSSWTHTLLLYT